MRSATAMATLVGSFSLVAFSTLPASAHPHIFAEASLDVKLNEAHQIEALRHVWRFDDLFSSTVLIEFDQNKDLQLDTSELEEVASVVHESLADYNYFQVVTVDGRDVAMEAPERLIADFTNNQLLILFESNPSKPLPLQGTITLGVYDPTFYTAIDFAEDRDLAVDDMPANCTSKVVRPDAEDAIAQNQQSLTEAFFNEPDGNDLSKIFATRLEIRCPSHG